MEIAEFGTYLSLLFAVCPLLELAFAKMALASIRKRPALRPVGKERSLALLKLAENIISTALILAHYFSSKLPSPKPIMLRFFQSIVCPSVGSSAHTSQPANMT